MIVLKTILVSRVGIALFIVKDDGEMVQCDTCHHYEHFSLQRSPGEGLCLTNILHANVVPYQFAFVVPCEFAFVEPNDHLDVGITRVHQLCVGGA